MPPRLNLSSQKIERHGCYLVENGQRILIWIGREVVPQLCIDLLNVSQASEIRSGQVTHSLLMYQSNVNSFIGSIIACTG
jgi:protein transport protein SEC24